MADPKLPIIGWALFSAHPYRLQPEILLRHLQAGHKAQAPDKKPEQPAAKRQKHDSDYSIEDVYQFDF